MKLKAKPAPVGLSSEAYGPSLCNVRCACGHSADLEQFTRTAVFGWLPPGEFQCPECARAWKVVKGRVTITSWGTVLDEPNRLVATERRL